MRVLITGSNGQLGQSINEQIENDNFAVFEQVDLPDFDITDEAFIKKYLLKNKPDVIVNCAAYTAVDKAEEDTETAHSVNTLGAKWLGKYSAACGGKVIHISTDYVFDGQHNLPLTPFDKANPKSVYGKTKLAGEQELVKENPNSIIIRTSWLYSPFGHNFLKTMLRLGKEKNEINVVFDQTGTPTSALDLASAIISVIKKMNENSESFQPGIYHYSNQGVCSWYDFAVTIFKIAGIHCKVNPVFSCDFPAVAPRPVYSVLDKSLFIAKFGGEIPHWTNGVERCLQHKEFN